jgi:hypothetical protein
VSHLLLPLSTFRFSFSVLHALRVCRAVFDDVQFDSVLYTFIFARRYIEATICSVSLSSLTSINFISLMQEAKHCVLFRVLNTLTRAGLYFSLYITPAQSRIYTCKYELSNFMLYHFAIARSIIKLLEHTCRPVIKMPTIVINKIYLCLLSM